MQFKERRGEDWRGHRGQVQGGMATESTGDGYGSALEKISYYLRDKEVRIRGSLSILVPPHMPRTLLPGNLKVTHKLEITKL